MVKPSPVRLDETYVCRMVLDSDGPYKIANFNFKVEWIHTHDREFNKMKRIVEDCILTGEEFVERYGIAPKLIRGSSLWGINLSYSNAE